MKTIDCTVAVIGAGPAGLAAAVGARDSGADRVVLIERDESLGGILQQCIHNGFGLHYLGRDLTGPEYAEHFIDEVRSRSITCLTQTMVLNLDRNLNMLAASAGGMIQIQPQAIVLAMGCRERTRGAIALPGHRPAGIMTAGTAQRFINIEGKLPGKSIVVLGSGDIGMIMARRLHLEGVRVLAVVEIMNCVGGLSRNLVQCLHDFDIPLYLRHTVTDIRGTRRLEGVDIAPLDDNDRPDMSRKIPLECDTLLLSVGLIPENELSRQADIELDQATGGPMVDQYFHTSVAGIFAAGNVVQVFDLVDHVTTCGIKAGGSAARFADGEIRHWADDSCPVRPGSEVRCVVPHRLTPGGDGPVEFYLRGDSVMRNVTLLLHNSSDETMFSKKLLAVQPPEMILVSLKSIPQNRGAEYTFELQSGG